MLEKPPTCAECPAFKIGKGFVPGEGSLDARLVLVGQGPGENEVATGRPFMPGYAASGQGVPVPGQAGRLLKEWMAQAELRRDEVWVDNVVRCGLPKNRKPTLREVQYCTTHHLFPALARLTHGREPLGLVIVPVGVPAFEVFYGKGAGEEYAGSLAVWKGVEIELDTTQGTS